MSDGATARVSARAVSDVFTSSFDCSAAVGLIAGSDCGGTTACGVLSEDPREKACARADRRRPAEAGPPFLFEVMVRFSTSHGTSGLDPIAAYAVDALRIDIETQLFLEGAADGAAHAVGLPARCFDRLLDSGAGFALEQIDERSLLGAC